MARIARRTLETFVDGLEPRVTRLALHTGDQRAPQHRGDLDLNDYREADTSGEGAGGGGPGKVMVARLVDVIGQRAEAYGFPQEHSSLLVIAYAGTKRVDSYQDTASTPQAGAAPGSALEQVIVRVMDTMRLSLADSNALAKEGFVAMGQGFATIAAKDAEIADLNAALAIKDAAIAEAEEGAKLTLQLRAIESLEKGVETWASGKGGGVSAAAISSLVRRRPEDAAKLLRQLVQDEEVKALFIKVLSAT